MVKKLVFGYMLPFVPRLYPMPMQDRPVYFDIALYERQSGDDDPFTAEHAARSDVLGYTVIWPVHQQSTRPDCLHRQRVQRADHAKHQQHPHKRPNSRAGCRGRRRAGAGIAQAPTR